MKKGLWSIPLLIAVAAVIWWAGSKEPAPPLPGAPERKALPRQADLAPQPSSATPLPLPAPAAKTPAVPPQPVASSVTPGAIITKRSSAPASRPAPGVDAGSPEPAAKGGAKSPPARTPDARALYLADLENVQLMLRDYRAVAGDNPVGSNAEIMKSIMGGNSKRAQLGPPGGQGINAAGELVDRWGTPYFFHQMSATIMEIRSAGPDAVMWTADDVFLR